MHWEPIAAEANQVDGLEAVVKLIVLLPRLEPSPKPIQVELFSSLKLLSKPNQIKLFHQLIPSITCIGSLLQPKLIDLLMLKPSSKSKPDLFTYFNHLAKANQVAEPEAVVVEANFNQVSQKLGMQL